MREAALDPRRPYKPLDVGEAGVAATLDEHGRLLYLGQSHPRHGVVTLTALPAFDERRRRDQAAVRAYRRRIARRGAAGFGLDRPRVPGPGMATFVEQAIPRSERPDGAVVTTFVPHPDDTGGARGLVQLVAGGRAGEPAWTWERLRLDRAPYPELTEAGPLSPQPLAPSREGLADGGLLLADESLGWAVAVREVAARSGARAAILGLGPQAAAAVEAAAALASIGPEELLGRSRERWRRRWEGWSALGRSESAGLDGLARRALAYLVGCCVAPVREAVCLVTDHRILPLAWTRDGYYLARALLDLGRGTGLAESVDLVRRHLTWLFEVAQRPEGWWARSHLIGGQAKDRVFQLDQQLYPLVELADYVETAGDRAPLVRFGPVVEEVLSVIAARRDAASGLYATIESAADDPAALPFVTANQILAWHAFRRLDGLGWGSGRLAALADAVRTATFEQLVVSGPDGPMLAAAGDGRGACSLAHDANDLPLALAPRWGFVRADDPRWRRAMAFAFSPRNPSFFAGPHGGLGSAHTPGPWTLGHLQALIVGPGAEDEAPRRAEAAGRALMNAAAWDGLLPEASDPRSGRPISRPWFAWPGAVLASEVLASQAPARAR